MMKRNVPCDRETGGYGVPPCWYARTRGGGPTGSSKGLLTLILSPLAGGALPISFYFMFFFSFLYLTIFYILLNLI